MKKFLLVTFLICCISFPQISNAQCGVMPASGLTTNAAAGVILNSYYPGTGNPTQGAASITVGTRDTRGSSAPLAAGDLIVIIQMQGADFNTSNNSSYGDGTSGGGSGALTTSLYAGTYEYNAVSSVAGSIITLSSPLARNYYTRAFAISSGIRNYQVIRVPRYYNYTLNATGSIVAPAWNGSTGGVVVLDVVNNFTLNGTINVTGLGFRGGGGKQFTGAGANSTSSTSSIVTLLNTDYRFYSAASTAANTTGGAKGEGIAGTPRYTYTQGATATVTGTVEGYRNGSMGRGAAANGGGGGTDGSPTGSGNNQNNTGGGGGANAGPGGFGGSGWHNGTGTITTYPYGGIGGSTFTVRSLQRLVMGGGGGAGTANNSDNTNEYQASGGAGGGIILVRAGSYSGTGSLLADGGAAPGLTGVPSTSNTDAGGGGGGGGTIVALTRTTLTGNTLSTLTASAQGGRGGDMLNYFDHGPGGGGGGGVIYANGTLASTSVIGGLNGKTRVGTTTGPATNDFGATPGGNGIVVTMLTAPGFFNPSGSSACGILPVTLASFTGLVQGNGTALNWEIADAERFSHFEVEFSSDGTHFATAGTVTYVDEKSKYAFLHNYSFSSIVFYRLKLVDKDGSYTYSKIITVRLNRTGNNMLVYPNPAREAVTVQVKSLEAAEASLSVLSASGAQVYVKNIRVLPGDNVFSLNVDKYPTGLYVIEIKMKNGQHVIEKLHVVRD